MTLPLLAIVGRHVGGTSGMGRVAGSTLIAAGNAGWRIAVITEDLDKELRYDLEHVRLTTSSAMPALPSALAWGTRARIAIQALRRRTRGQLVVHGDEPWLLPSCDIVTCHHLAATGYGGASPLGAGGELREAAKRMQYKLVLRGDNILYKRYRDQTPVVFVSGLLRDEYQKRYGRPLLAEVLTPPVAPYRQVTASERFASRLRLGIRHERKLVVGYLGGNDFRKGLDVVRLLDRDESVTVLAAGPGSSRSSTLFRNWLGFTTTEDVIAASDVIVVPSTFDAGPLTAVEAVSRGVPIVISAHCGWSEELVCRRLAVPWAGDPRRIAEAVRAAAHLTMSAATQFCLDHDDRRFQRELMSCYDKVNTGLAPL